MKFKLFITISILTLSLQIFAQSSDEYFGKATKLTDYFTLTTEEEVTEFTLKISKIDIENINKLKEIAKSTKESNVKRGGIAAIKKKKVKK